MRSRSDRVRRLEQRQLAAHRAFGQIKFHNLRSVPQRDKCTPPSLRHRQRHRIGPGHRIALREIEALLDGAARRVNQHHIVRQIVGHQQLLRPAVPTTAMAAGNGTPLSPSVPPISRRLSARRPVAAAAENQPLRRDLAAAEAVHHHRIAGLAIAIAQRIGGRAHARVQMVSVAG